VSRTFSKSPRRSPPNSPRITHRAAIARARCRFELTSDDDPDMDHLNDMIFICQAAAAIGQVFIFDPQSGEFQ
jgi:hypothetical protein